MPHTFRSSLPDYFHSQNAEFRIISEEVDTKFESTAIASLNGSFLTIFKKLKGYSGFRLVSNLLGTEDRILFFSGCRSRAEFLKRWKQALSKENDNTEFAIDTKPPFKERIFKGSEIDLNILPVPEHYINDGSRLSRRKYITSGLIISRNPDNREILNMGYGRIQILDRNRFAFDSGSKGHTWSYIMRSMETGEPMDFTVVIGTHPVFYLLGAAFIEDEYHRAGEFIDFRLASGLMNNIPVPSDSEIVIEARHNPGEVVEEGPFGEYTGYMGYDTTGFTATCKSLMFRKDPVYYDILPSNSREHVNAFSYPRSLLIESRIADSLPGNSQIRIEWPHYASRFLALGYAESGAGDIAMQAACGVIAQDPLWGKFVLMYRRKNSLEIPGFLAAIAASSEHGFSNITVLPESFIISSDVSSGGRMKSSRLIAILDPVPYKVEKSGNHVVISDGKHGCLISHGYSEGMELEIFVPEDVDITDFSRVGWVLSTRVNPGMDLRFDGMKLSIDARRVGPEIPEMPADQTKSAERIVSSYISSKAMSRETQGISPFS